MYVKSNTKKEIRIRVSADTIETKSLETAQNQELRMQHLDNKQLEGYSKNYSEENFWQKLKKHSQKAGRKIVYLTLLLFYMLQSDEVSIRNKSLLMGALGYFILPFDFLPDMLPVGGYSDDLTLLMWTFHKVNANLTSTIKKQAMQQLIEWFGELDESELEIV